MTAKRVLAAFGEGGADRPPLWLMRQAGRYLPEYRALREREPDFLKFCYTPALTVEAALQPVRRFGLDAAIVFSDILVVPDALGCRVEFVEGQGPRLEPVRDERDVARLGDAGIEARVAPVFEAIHLLRRALADDVGIIGFAGAPWTIALYMVEGRGGGESERVRTWALTAPASFEALIARIVDATTDFLLGQIASGVEIIQLFDSWAGLLPETMVRRWVIEPTAEIVRRLKARHPEVPLIGFPRGIGVLCSDYLGETGVDGISIDAGVPVAWARTALQPYGLVQGNLDNLVLAGGGPMLEMETRRILAALAGGRFIFNLGHGILPHTPPEHVAELAAIVRRWRCGDRA